MSAMQPQRVDIPLGLGPAPEEASRADLYALIGRLFYAPPDAELMGMIAGTVLLGEGDDNALRSCWSALQEACRKADVQAVEDEFNTLFVSVGQSAINPLGSFYMTGFLNDRPLGDLRMELDRIGFRKLKPSAETEDHLSALADVMRLMILGGAEGGAAPIEAQQAFFERFIKPWYARLAADLEGSGSASFYKLVGRLTKAFFDVESASFEIA